jgi:hypothetical protein
MTSALSDWLNDWYPRLQFILLGCVLVTTAVTGLTTIAGVISNARQSKTITGLNKATEQLHGDNIVAQKALEDERNERIKMEASVAPRSIDQSQLKAFQKFTPMNAMVVSVPEWEARQTAGQIKFLLHEAGWNIIDDNVHPMFRALPVDGIHIEIPRLIRDNPSSFREWITPTPEDSMNKDLSLLEAAEELRKQLVDGSGVDAVISNTLALPPKTLRIAVGVNPMTYFKEKALEKARARAEKRQKQETPTPNP